MEFKEEIEKVARRFRDEMGARCFVVVRAGRWGAYVLDCGEGEGDLHLGVWSEAYFGDQGEARDKVKDATGAGNAFLVRFLFGAFFQQRYTTDGVV